MREPPHGLAGVVERALGLLQAEVGHLLVDLAGELDELGREVVLAGLPGQVERVDRQAVAAHSGAWLEAHEAVGLGRGRVDDLPDVDAHAVGEHRHLVHERDVDRAEDVLEQLGELGDLGRRDAHDLVAHGRVDRDRGVGAGRREAADDLRRRAEGEVGPARVHALGREGQREVLPGAQPALLEQRHHVLARRAGERRRLEDHGLAAADDSGQRLRGAEQRAQVRLAIARQRRGDAHEDRVRLVQFDVARGERAALLHRGEPRVGDVLDVRSTLAQAGDLALVGVQAHDVATRLSERDGERQADVPEADDADLHRAHTTSRAGRGRSAPSGGSAPRSSSWASSPARARPCSRRRRGDRPRPGA